MHIAESNHPQELVSLQFKHLADHYQLKINERTIELIAKQVSSKSFKQGEMVLAPGAYQTDLLLLVSGIIMSFKESATNLHVAAFAYPPDLAAVPHAYFRQEPSEYGLQAMADTQLIAIPKLVIDRGFDADQQFERLFRLMVQDLLIRNISRQDDLQQLSAQQRFLQFCQRSGHLLQLVPHKYIASYLRIDPTNFSKLYNNVRI